MDKKIKKYINELMKITDTLRADNALSDIKPIYRKLSRLQDALLKANAKYKEKMRA